MIEVTHTETKAGEIIVCLQTTMVHDYSDDCSSAFLSLYTGYPLYLTGCHYISVFKPWMMYLPLLFFVAIGAELFLWCPVISA